MRNIRRIYGFVVTLLVMSMASYAMRMPFWQDNRTRTTNRQQPQKQTEPQRKDTIDIKAQPQLDDDLNIPDSLLNPRWKIQRTLPVTIDDLNQSPLDLKRPQNLPVSYTHLRAHETS